MADKHIFIGLGGTGVNVVSYLKYKIYGRTKATEMKSRIQVMKENYRFIFVDTDNRDVDHFNDVYKHVYEGGREQFISPSELLNLGNQNPAAIWREANANPVGRKSRRILEACNELVVANMGDRTLSKGAEAFRMNSRLAFAQMESQFISKVVTAINELNPVEKNSESNVIHYWVVSSCNGGTGSGTLNDVLYLVNMLHKTHVEPGNPILGLVLFMPRLYININPKNERYPVNTIAVFKELDAIQSWATDPEKNKLYHRLAVLGDDVNINNTLPYRPFEFCIPIDINTDNFNNLGDPDKLYRNTAELLYYIHDGEGGDGFKSFINNNETGDPSIRNAHNYLVPLGYVAIRKPEEEFKNYMDLRLKYELLRYGVLGDGIDSETQREKEMMTVFDNLIKKMALTDGAEGEYFTAIHNEVKQRIARGLPPQMILDSKGKTVSVLPPNVSKATAEKIIEGVSESMHAKKEERGNTIKAIEKSLWKWTEDNARKVGLMYVRDVLRELDAFCTHLNDAYVLGNDNSRLRGISESQKALKEQRDTLAKNLDQFYQEAINISLGERLKNSNSEDVQAYYNQLKKWVTASVKVMLADAAFEMIQELAVGEQGIIDGIIRHVEKLISAATLALNKDNGVAAAYKGLAELFYATKNDVTSIYIPDITEYSNGSTWVEDGNKFSEWYSRIIGRTNRVVEGEGFAPLRNGDVKVSIEAFFSYMMGINEEKMVQDRYLVEKENHLFTNTSRSDYGRTIEDILYYAGIALEARIMEDSVISEQWSKKSLAEFYSELNVEAQNDIRRRTNPPVFFPYNKSLNLGPVTEKGFSVGPRGVVQRVFESTAEVGRLDFRSSDDPSVMYKVDTKLGFSFEYYDMYRMLEEKYNRCPNKSFYHFHQVFADAGGDANQIKLPREIDPETELFVKYLILNELSPSLAHIMKVGTEAFNAKFYSNTPVIFEGMLAKFATASSEKMIDNEIIELKITDGTHHFFHSVTINNPEHRYTDILAGFKANAANGRFEALVKDLIKNINFLESDLIQQKYLECVKRLKAKMNEAWEKAGKKEKDTLGEILEVLNERLDTVAKFLSDIKR